MQRNRDEIRWDLQCNIVDQFFSLRDRPELRPRRLLKLKTVWRREPGCHSHGLSMMNAKVIDLISLEYSALEHLLNRHDIEANFRKPDTDESDLQVMQRFHRRNTAPKPALSTKDTTLVFFQISIRCLEGPNARVFADTSSSQERASQNDVGTTAPKNTVV